MLTHAQIIYHGYLTSRLPALEDLASILSDLSGHVLLNAAPRRGSGAVVLVRDANEDRSTHRPIRIHGSIRAGQAEKRTRDLR